MQVFMAASDVSKVGGGERSPVHSRRRREKKGKNSGIV
jgi:hypothetical protein